MRLLVCGGRDWEDYAATVAALNQLPFEPTILITGNAPGADLMADRWAGARGLHVARVPALWGWHNKAAGPRRNSAMMALEPQYCVAFPGGRGTADMVGKCKRAGVTVWTPYG